MHEGLSLDLHFDGYLLGSVEDELSFREITSNLELWFNLIPPDVDFVHSLIPSMYRFTHVGTNIGDRSSLLLLFFLLSNLVKRHVTTKQTTHSPIVIM